MECFLPIAVGIGVAGAISLIIWWSGLGKYGDY